MIVRNGFNKEKLTKDSLQKFKMNLIKIFKFKLDGKAFILVIIQI